MKETNKLTDDIVINKALIRQRVKQNLFVGTGHGGTYLPLAMIELHIVDMLIVLARMRESLSPTQCIHFINDLIKGTEAHNALIKFKTKNTYRVSGKV